MLCISYVATKKNGLRKQQADLGQQTKTRATYTRQKSRVESFYHSCLRRILGTTWRDKVTNTTALEQTDFLNACLQLSQQRLRCFGHMHRMKDDRIPKDVIYNALTTGHSPDGGPSLRSNPRMSVYVDVMIKVTIINHSQTTDSASASQGALQTSEK